MAANTPRSPRQKMINLMYLVFIAMLALNVSVEVLDGFDLVEEGLEQTIETTESQNDIIIRRLTEINEDNPEKAGDAYRQAQDFKKRSDELFDYIQELKKRIAVEADGEDADVTDIQRRDGLSPSSVVMLGSSDKEGEKLKAALDAYRQLSVNLVMDGIKKENIRKRLSTDIPKKSRWDNKSWEEAYFEQMPTTAAVTLLTKMQNDVRTVEGEVLADLYDNVDAGDYRVNLLEAQVIPRSEFVMEGSPYQGRVVLSAVDTTKRPTFNIPGINPDGEFSIGAGGAGLNKVFSGILRLSTPEGERDYPFRSEYHVVPRMSTIQVMEANVLYAGEPNRLTISVPGASNEQLRAAATNGTITKSGENWIATPAVPGTNMKISVFNNRTNSLVSEQEFRVRILPDPTPYFEFPDANGNLKRFKSGGRISKMAMLNVQNVGASIDDGLIDRQFDVLRFSVVVHDAMGNRIAAVSTSNRMTEEQKGLIRPLGRGKSFYISDVKARGRDGVERDLATLEVRLN